MSFITIPCTYLCQQYRRANYFMTEFSKLGLPASTQKYALSTSQEVSL